MQILTIEELSSLDIRDRVKYVNKLWDKWEENIEIPVWGQELIDLPPSACPDDKLPVNGQAQTGKCSTCPFFMGVHGRENREYSFGETLKGCCALRLNAKLSGEKIKEFKLPRYFVERQK